MHVIVLVVSSLGSCGRAVAAPTNQALKHRSLLHLPEGQTSNMTYEKPIALYCSLFVKVLAIMLGNLYYEHYPMSPSDFVSSGEIPRACGLISAYLYTRFVYKYKQEVDM